MAASTASRWVVVAPALGPALLAGGAFGESSVCSNRATSTGWIDSSDVSGAPQNALWKAIRARGPSRRVPAALERDRDVGGLGTADHGGRFGTVEHAQRDPQVRVGQDVLVDRTRRPLGGQDEMDAEAAAPLGDVDDAGHELGDLLHQGRELVDDDDQRRRCLVGRDLEHLGEVLRPALHHPHAPVQFGAQRRERPQRQFGVEVRDVADRVRQTGEHRRAGPALVVDEQEVESRRRMMHRQRRDDRLQQLALARARRAADERVRAVLDEVEPEQAVDPHPDGEPEAVRPGGEPLLGHPLRRRHPDAEHVEQRRGARDRRGERCRARRRGWAPGRGRRGRRRRTGAARRRSRGRAPPGRSTTACRRVPRRAPDGSRGSGLAWRGTSAAVSASQITEIPTSGHSSSSRATPAGSGASRASSTTTIHGQRRPATSRSEPARRKSTTSRRRRSSVSASALVVATCEPGSGDTTDLVCGSHFIHEPSARSPTAATMVRSSGLCRQAAWIDHRRGDTVHDVVGAVQPDDAAARRDRR